MDAVALVLSAPCSNRDFSTAKQSVDRAVAGGCRALCDRAAGCAFRYQSCHARAPTEFQPTAPDRSGWTLRQEQSVGLGSGFPTKLRAGTRWQLAGHRVTRQRLSHKRSDRSRSRHVEYAYEAMVVTRKATTASDSICRSKPRFRRGGKPGGVGNGARNPMMKRSIPEMIRVPRLLLALLAAALLARVRNIRRDLYGTPAEAGPTGGGTGTHLYIYRTHDHGRGGVQPSVKLNDVVVGSSRLPRGFIYLDRPAGNLYGQLGDRGDQDAQFRLWREVRCAIARN